MLSEVKYDHGEGKGEYLKEKGRDERGNLNLKG
jgi:hypothetical protein